MIWRWCLSSQAHPLLVNSVDTRSKRQKSTATLCVTLKVNVTAVPMKKLISLAVGLIVAQIAWGAEARLADAPEASQNVKLHLQFSPYTYHYTPDDEHRNVLMAGLEREYTSGKLDGVTAFSNSFGQPCVYLYPWGGVWRGLAGVDALSFKWTAGVLYGYKPPYENKVPLNKGGFSPAAIVALAYQLTPKWSAQANLLGTAALMFQINMQIR
jgi:hypothetical protein